MSNCLLQIGVLFQPVEVEKSVFAPVIEAMILKVSKALKESSHSTVIDIN